MLNPHNESPPSEDLLTQVAEVSPSGLLEALRFFVIIIGALVLFLGVSVGASSLFHLDQDATFIVAFGMFAIGATLLRPWWFWYHPTALFVRHLLTDVGAIMLYLAIGTVAVTIGVRRELAVRSARAACVQAYASARDSHERVRVLHHQGASDLPSDGGRNTPKSITCERLLQ